MQRNRGTGLGTSRKGRKGNAGEDEKMFLFEEVELRSVAALMCRALLNAPGKDWL
jgi:hypothetical protein